MKHNNHIRRQFIVDKEFQYRLVRKFTIISVLIVIGSLTLFALVFYKYGDIRIDVLQPDPFNLDDSVGIGDAPQGNSIIGLLWPVMSICLFCTLLSTIIFGVFVSHKMAGPVFRMRRLLKEMAQGDLSSPRSKLRKKDEFSNLFADIQSIKDNWKEKIHELQLLCKGLKEDGDQKQDLDRIREIAFGFKTAKD